MNKTVFQYFIDEIAPYIYVTVKNEEYYRFLTLI